jgi:multidrug efflux pump subunit AcrB
MREVAGAVIATSVVLVAVFVPVAFFPGTTGILYKQFALTIAFAVALSAFNALTLSPALAAKLLGHEREHRTGIFARINRVIAATTARYQGSLGGLIRRRGLVLVLFVGALGLTVLVYRLVPGGFVPDEDQGYFIVAVQAPEGASLQYTAGIAAQASVVLAKEPEILGVFAVIDSRFRAPSAGDPLRADEAPLPAQGSEALRRRGDRSRRRAALRHPGSDRDSLPTAADRRGGEFRGIPVRGPGSVGRIGGGSVRSDPEPRRGGQPRSGAPRTLHELHVERSAVRRHDRP